VNSVSLRGSPFWYYNTRSAGSLLFRAKLIKINVIWTRAVNSRMAKCCWPCGHRVDFALHLLNKIVEIVLWVFGGETLGGRCRNNYFVMQIVNCELLGVCVYSSGNAITSVLCNCLQLHYE